jgi:hypothetical protein
MDDHAVIVADPTGVIRQWNRGAETLFGYLAEEAVGRSLDLVVPEHLRDANWAEFRRAMTDPQIKDLGGSPPCSARTARSDPSPDGLDVAGGSPRLRGLPRIGFEQFQYLSLGPH